jgi:hypothetical protein
MLRAGRAFLSARERPQSPCEASADPYGGGGLDDAGPARGIDYCFADVFINVDVCRGTD